MADLNSSPQWTTATAGIISRLKEGVTFVLHGMNGNGKTQCAVTALKANCAGGYASRYYRARDINNYLLDMQQDGHRCRAINTLVSPSLLVIDEWEKRFNTEYSQESLSLVIDKRYGAMKSTIIISNLKADKLVEVLGSSVVDRIKETGGLIEFTWPSFRGQNTGGNNES